MDLFFILILCLGIKNDTMTSKHHVKNLNVCNCYKITGDCQQDTYIVQVSSNPRGKFVLEISGTKAQYSAHWMMVHTEKFTGGFTDESYCGFLRFLLWRKLWGSTSA